MLPLLLSAIMEKLKPCIQLKLNIRTSVVDSTPTPKQKM